ncbi:MAG: hypothetical protein ACLPXW_15305 [Xanthobacteraceae bacterium]
MSDEIKTIHVHMKGPSPSKPGGVSVMGHYRAEDGFVVMCKPDGVPIELNGKRFRRKFGTRSGELNEREVARMMTLEIRHELKRSPHSPVPGFSGPISYPKGF